MPILQKYPTAWFMLALACATGLLVAAGLSEPADVMDKVVMTAAPRTTPAAR